LKEGTNTRIPRRQWKKEWNCLLEPTEERKLNKSLRTGPEGKECKTQSVVRVKVMKKEKVQKLQ